MSFIRWHEKRPNAEQAYDLVAEHFDVDLDDAPEHVTAEAFRVEDRFERQEV